MEMKIKSLRSLRSQVENRIASIDHKIDAKEKELNNMEPETTEARVYISSISKQSLAEAILSGAELVVDYDSCDPIYFIQNKEETRQEFESRKNLVAKSLVNLRRDLEDTRKELAELVESQDNERTKYKNPEYIEYLKLKKKFEFV